ncbi:TrkH family potassium uptake protein [Oligoflexus tunisiensis]|uniref:TrkH family potassium uptake protein n=1 Tax=Oligoflexus tunisiensis TaxID=708132 RepID=UPI00114C8B59|nr:potassium transporter TrkG [Oligoflexus tunisiensis]
MLKFLYLNPLKLGFFLTLGTSFAIVLSASHQLLPALGTRVDPGLLVSLGLSLIAFLFFFDGRKARWLMGLGLLTATVVSLFYLYLLPARAYFVLCLLMLSAYLLPGVVTHERWRPDAFRHDLLKSMLLMTTLNWVLVQLFRVTADTMAQAWLVFSTWLCLIFSFMDRYYNRLAWKKGSLFLAAGALVIGILPVFLLRSEYLVSASRLSFFGLLACATTFRYKTGVRRRFTKIMEGLFFHPEGVVITFFLWFCLIGTLLLAVPFRGVAGGGIALIDAAFTAVSAVCITGLTVLDTVKHFSVVDQVIILILIQVGGLGIMTLSSLALFLMGQRMSVTQEATLASVIGQKKLKSEMRHTLARVLVFTLLVEAAGAIVLTLAFAKAGQPWTMAIWKGIFTAISAFCNAGFALESANLIPWQQHPVILHTVAILIIVGGLSPAFVMALPRLGREGPVPIQYKLVLVATIVLLFGGTLILLGLEWNAAFKDLSVADKIHNAWFHSVTTRTAGFNAVDMTTLTKSSTYVMMFLMFVGGSPGGTSGGIKTTTFMVLLFTAANIIRGRQEVQILGRHLRHSTVYRAMTVTFLAMAVVTLAFLILLMSQPLDSEKLLFEVFAALGTAGLSLGITPQLDAFGKAVIMACMFLGRVGPLSVFIFMLEQPTRSRWTLPSEDVVVT